MSFLSNPSLDSLLRVLIRSLSSSYDFFKEKLLGFQFQDGIGLHCIASVSAGLVATSESILLCVKSTLIKSNSYLCPLWRNEVEAYVRCRYCFNPNGSELTIVMIIFFLKAHDARVAEVFLKSLRDEGPRFLFKGWTPAFIRLGPNTVLLFVFFEVTWLSFPVLYLF